MNTTVTRSISIMDMRTEPRGKAGHAAALLPGLALAAGLAELAVLLSRSTWCQSHGLSALTLAILFGMLAGNSVYPRIAGPVHAGVAFSKQTLLRLGVVLYGFRLTLHDVGSVGIVGVGADIVVVLGTFIAAIAIGTRWLGLDRRTAMLIGAGSAICGAAAVMATEPVVRGRSEQVTVAVATVIVFGTLATFLYPALYALNGHWQLIGGGTKGFGIYIGSTVHEVAQVIAAARAVDPAAVDAAVITKMVRVLLLAPFLLGLSMWLTRERAADADPDAASGRSAIAIPGFALAFLGMVLVNSLHLIPAALATRVLDLDTLILATAMAALGLTTHVSAVRSAGLRPLLLAFALFLLLIVGGAAVNHLIGVLA